MSQQDGPMALGAIEPARLAAARIELHWAAQVLAAAADAALVRAGDDSHTNLFWDDENSALIGRPLAEGLTLGLRFKDASLIALRAKAPGSEFALPGKSLADALGWASATIDAKKSLEIRDYEMPAHREIQNGGPFADAGDAHEELGRYYNLATVVLSTLADAESGATPIAVWPHHFDLGGIVFLEEASEAAAQIGFGLSPGDGTISEPYFYVTPWPLAEDPALPPLEGGGSWQRAGFTGAVLRASDLTSGAPEEQHRRIGAFIASAMTAGRRLISEAR